MKKLLAIVGLLSICASSALASNSANFQPSGATLSISATTASASASFTTTGQINASQMELINAGTVTAFCRWGVGAQTALATDLPILAGVVFGVTKGNADTVACITASGTTTVYASPGEGY